MVERQGHPGAGDGHLGSLLGRSTWNCIVPVAREGTTSIEPLTRSRRITLLYIKYLEPKP